MKASRITYWLSTALAVVALGPPSAGAFEVAEISMKELSDLSIVDFESSFCEVVVGDTVTVTLMGTEGDAATATIVAASPKPQNGATPNRGKGNGRGGARTGEIESSFRDFAARAGLRSAACSINCSTSECCLSSCTAVFGPMPRAPGMLSEASPTSAR